MKTYPCFGLESLGQCNYDPTNPTVYFSIGQLIPLFIVAITVYSLTDPIIKLRIRSNRLFRLKLNFRILRKWTHKIQFPDSFQPLALFVRNSIPSIELNPFYYLALLSIGSIFFSSIIPSISNFYTIPIIGYPVFWEILSGLILAFLSLYFIKVINMLAELNKHNYKEFFNCSLNIIGRREEKELISLARELIPSLEIIMSIGENYYSFYSHVQHLAHKKHASNEKSVYVYQLNKFIEKDKELSKMVQLNEYQWFCFRIIDLLSDKYFCKTIACKVPEFSEKFFSTVLFNNYNTTNHRKIFGNIMKSSFENEDSILNRESQYDGLRGVSNLTSLVFENSKLFSQFTFKSLLSWIERVEFTQEWQIKLYFSCLEAALKFSFNIENHQTLKNIHNGYLEIEDILNDIFYSKISFEQKMNLFNCISFEINQALDIVNENEDKIKKYSSKSPSLFPRFFHSEKKGWHQISLYHILAKSIFDFLTTLSRIDIRNSDEQLSVRNVGIDLLMHLLMGDKRKKSNKEMGKILISYIKFNIAETNFKNRWYPPLTKYMISVFSLYYSKEEKSEWDSFHIWFLNKLKKEFHSLYITDKQFALDLLPFNVSYDPSKKLFTQVVPHLRFEKDRVLQCE